MRLLPRIQTGAALRAILLGAALAAAFPAIADNLPDVQKLIKQAQYPQALTKVDAYLATKPKDAQGRFLKGLILTEMNKPSEAIAVFTKLTEDYPELPEPYNNLAVLYAQQKQYDKSRTALEMAIRTHPAYAIAYENLGDVYAKLASQAYDKALQIDSSNSGAQNKLALIRDLISTSGKPGVRPQMPVAKVEPKLEPVKVAAAPPPPAPAPAPAAAAPTPAAKPPTPATPSPAAPTATVISTTPATTAAPAKPAPTPVAAKVDSGSEDIAKALAGWASAWSRKDVKTYLAYYSGDFKPPKGLSRKAWEAQREERIAGKGGKISVSFDDPKITVNGDKATVKFRQHYKASSLTTSTNKTLIMVRSGSKWLIQDEDSR
ncbi:MAG: tetratricopeptide repeat protein [Betaproteobacteria bacterium]